MRTYTLQLFCKNFIVKGFIWLFIFNSSFLVSSQVSNDDCSGAISIPVNSSCSYTTGSNFGATASSGVSNPSCGGYLGGDIWYSFVAPTTGSVTINTISTTGPTDMDMALYSGTCGALSELECDDFDGPGVMPMINYTGLTPGDTYYVRFWEFGDNIFGDFDFLKKQNYNASYKDGAIYVLNNQEGNNDVLDDIVHEIGHSVEDNYHDLIYGDGLLEKEFIKKRVILRKELAKEGIDIPEEVMMNPDYNQGLDIFFSEKIGYPKMTSIVQGIFVDGVIYFL